MIVNVLKINDWPLQFKEKLSFEFREPIYPSGQKNWVKLFGECATLRLFLPVCV